MRLRSASLFRKNEPCTYPHSARTQHQSRSQRLTVVKTASGNNLNLLSSQRALLVLAELQDRWDKNSGRHIASVTTTFTALSADHIYANVKAFLNVLGMANHVHVENASLVELLDDGFWWNADGGDEELRTAVDYYID